MEYNEIKIKEGIKLHLIKTEKFKTNLIAVMLTSKLQKENVTSHALIPMVLKRGTQNMQTQEEINKVLEEMYGASFDCGIDKIGDNQVLKFYMETLNDEFIPREKEKLLMKSIEKFFEIIFQPYLQNNMFKKQYVEQEKENLRQIIEGKSDNKARYALERCIEEMYKEQPYGLYKFGNIEDLKDINEKTLYNNYENLLCTCKIDIFISGKIDNEIEKNIIENKNIINLKERIPEYELYKIDKENKGQENIIEEIMDVTQGKLILGLDVYLEKEEQKYETMIYNSILGGSANSKLFQNVREKASLAYTASSTYMRQKNNIFINCGIEVENYDKAVEIIKQQIEEMKNGNFSDEEVEQAKQGIIALIRGIDDEQDTEITFLFGQELSKTKIDLNKYIENIEKVNKQGVLNVANKVSINTIYFLKN